MQQYIVSQYLDWAKSKREQLCKQIEHNHPEVPIIYGTILGTVGASTASAIGAYKGIFGNLSPHMFISSILIIPPIGILLGIAGSFIIPKMIRRRNEKIIRALDYAEENLNYPQELSRTPYLLI